MSQPQRFVALFDIHWGKERVDGRVSVLHDLESINVVLKFMRDFKPHIVILGGDQVDCSPISHWNSDIRRRTEGFRLSEDLGGFKSSVLDPINAMRPRRKIWLTGNHEDWIEQFIDKHPELEGIIELNQLLQLNRTGWETYRQGAVMRIGKLHFTHGDSIRGGEYVARTAALAYERNVRFGHHHTYQTYTKTSACDLEDRRTAIAVPCLCLKAPAYAKSAPNRWVSGFNWGYINEDGTFTDYITIITRGKFIALGKEYKL